MAKESVLTQAEKESFKIKRFIFHIIKQSELNPIFLDEVVLDKNQERFFQDRFGDVSQGTQFEFNDKRTSDVYKKCVAIIKDPEKNFLEVSKELTASFKSHHINKSTNDGVFITALVSVMDKTDLVFLIKLDNRKVYGYSIDKKKAMMKEIKNTFVEDSRAVQKIAIVNVVGYRVWDVIARDRSAVSGKAIRDYFADFLTVHERETPSVLTGKVVSAIRQWAIANKSYLDPSQEVSSYKNRCIDYLRNSSKVKSRDLINTVILDDDSERAKKLRKSLRSYLQDKGLEGQEFKPNSKALDTATTKNVRRTAEGVKIEWEGDAKDVNVSIPNEPDNNGNFNILIQTTNVEILK
jgi:37-kD nucleoid-associated bacterial protein